MLLFPRVGGLEHDRVRVLRHVTNFSGRARFWYSNGDAVPRAGQANRLRWGKSIGMSSRRASASKSARLTVRAGSGFNAGGSRDVSRMVGLLSICPSCSSLTTGAATLKDACAPQGGGPRAILDRGSPRRPGDFQAGTKKRRVVSRTKKPDEAGSQDWPGERRR